MTILPRLALAALAVSALAGCTVNTFTSVARARAATDFSCPEGNIIVERKAGNTVAAAGCGRTQNYSCEMPANASIACVPEGQSLPSTGAVAPVALPPPGATSVPRPAPAPEK